MNNQPIGIFDSGIGGINVLKEIIKLLPNEKYIYYADIDNVPYGVKTNEQVKQYVYKAIDFFLSKNVKAIVIACNTATSVTIEELRKKYILPIIGIEPAVKPAIENRINKKVMLMATPITLKERKLNNLINKLQAEEYIDLVPMPKLVEFAEKKDFYSQDVYEYINNELKEYNLEEYSFLVLGCTHFPFFKEALQRIFPKEIEIIDGSFGVAKRIRRILEQNNSIGNSNLQVEYYKSGRFIEENSELIKLIKC